MENDWSSLIAHPPLPLLALVTFLGAAIGSFLTLATYRLPRDEKIGITRSRCPSCQTSLTPLDLVPVFSWLASRGRCRHCKTAVSARYPLTELGCALGTLLIALHYGLTLEGLAITGLWWSVVAIIVTDLEHYIILDEVQIAIGLFGMLYVYATGTSPQYAALTACIGGAIGLTLKYGFIYLRNKDGLGMGDVKFLCVAGIWLAHAANFVPFLFFSGFFGIVSGLGWRFAGRGERFPFGPALAAALFLCIYFPHLPEAFWHSEELLLLGSSRQN